MVQFLIDFLNLIIKALGSVVSAILSILPDSPFQLIDNSPIADFIGGLNWIIPISSIVAILSAWVVCIGTYYIVMLVLRWAKAIE